MLSKTMKNKLVLIINLALLLVTQYSHAQISISNSIIHLKAKKNAREDIFVLNHADQTAYINISPYIVLHPGTQQEKHVLIHNANRQGLLVTPHMFIIPPHGRHVVRFIITKPREHHETIYRVNISPVAQKLILDNKTKTSKRFGVRVIIGYGTLIIVTPEHFHSRLVAYRKGKKLTLTNKGKSNVLIKKIKQCDNLDKVCSTLPGRRIYANTTVSITLKSDHSVTLIDESNKKINVS